jgi:uncharacterized BrkB/YihY/UPF0761 family membrane protein
VHTAFALAPESSADGANDLAQDVGLGAFAIASVSEAATDASGGRVGLLLVALFAVALTGSNLVRAMALTHRLAWGLPRQRMRRSPLGVALAAAAALTLLGTNLLAARLDDLPLAGRLAGAAVSFAVYVGSWLLLSARLPHGGAPTRALLPGALLVGAGGLALHVATAFYLIDRADRASSVYGPLGVATVLLLWLFILGRLIVAAALLNASLARQDHPLRMT